jgi:hypothetical protein
MCSHGSPVNEDEHVRGRWLPSDPFLHRALPLHQQREGDLRPESSSTAPWSREARHCHCVQKGVREGEVIGVG